MDRNIARVIIFFAAIGGSVWFLLDTVYSQDILEDFAYLVHFLTCVAGLAASSTIAVGAGILLWDGDPQVLIIGTYIMLGTLVDILIRQICWWVKFGFEASADRERKSLVQKASRVQSKRLNEGRKYFLSALETMSTTIG